ncbi:spore coat biosynthesis protein F [Leptospira sp. WS92.C1]
MSGILSTPKIYALIQARTASTRLPGKVLKEFPFGSGKTLIDRIQDRIRTLLDEDQIYYLIPEKDEELRSFLEKRNYRYFCGNLFDVRDRYIQASELLDAKWILRLTGDNPFYDTTHLDQLLQTFQFAKPDLAYVRNLPLGMGGEIFTTDALRWTPDVLEEKHKEHVSLHIKENSERFQILKLSSLLTEKEKEVLPNLRLTIDEPKDFETTAAIFKVFIDQNPLFGAKECIDLYEQNPSLFYGNREVEQIRFQVPAVPEEKKNRIGVLAGNPKQFGSGHFERSRILFALLSARGYEAVWYRDFPKDGDSKLLIIDSRDIPIPEYSKTKILLLDHFGPDRNRYDHYEILPHPKIKDDFSTDQILISPRLKELSVVSESYLLCYAGNIDPQFTKKLDSYLESLCDLEKTDKVIRIGGSSQKSGSIDYYPRISMFEFQNRLAACSGFIGYFGQSLFEAVFLRKKVSTYSIGPVHASLSIVSEKEYGIPYAGDLNSENFGKHRELKKSTRSISGDGYSLLLNEIKKILNS